MYTIEIIEGQMFLVLEKPVGVPDRIKDVVVPRMPINGTTVDFEHVSISISDDGVVKVNIRTNGEAFVKKIIPQKTPATKKPIMVARSKIKDINPFTNFLHTIQGVRKHVKEQNRINPEILKYHRISKHTLILIEGQDIIMRKLVKMIDNRLYLTFSMDEISALPEEFTISFSKYIVEDARKYRTTKQFYSESEVIDCYSTKLVGNGFYSPDHSINDRRTEDIKAQREAAT